MRHQSRSSSSKIGWQAEGVFGAHPVSQPHVVGGIQAYLAGDALGGAVKRERALRIVVALLLHRLELMDRLWRPRRDLLMFGRLRFAADAAKVVSRNRS
jgi:hypothetical protein